MLIPDPFTSMTPADVKYSMAQYILNGSHVSCGHLILDQAVVKLKLSVLHFPFR